MNGGLRPVRQRLVCPRAGEPASRILVEARHDPGDVPVNELVTEEPLVVHEPDGSFTPEVRRMLGETL